MKIEERNTDLFARVFRCHSDRAVHRQESGPLGTIQSHDPGVRATLGLLDPRMRMGASP
jgi:hypothetical protein